MNKFCPKMSEINNPEQKKVEFVSFSRVFWLFAEKKHGEVSIIVN